MELHTLLALLTLLAGFYMAWNIGANDVANAMGTSVGSKALTLRKAVCLAAVLEFCGAFFIGSSVSETIQHGIVNPALFATDPNQFVFGMLGALLATGVLLQFASYFGLPVSTTHAIVGAVLGFGLISRGTDAICWNVVLEIAASWVLSPCLSAIVSYFLFSLIQRRIFYALHPLEAARKLAPLFVFCSISLVSWSLLHHGHLPHLVKGSLFMILGLSSICGGVGALLTHQFLRRFLSLIPQPVQSINPQQSVSLEKAIHHLQRMYLANRDETLQNKLSLALIGLRELREETKKSAPFIYSTTQYSGVEKIFVYLQILSASLVAFAHGANDVANAIGPVSAVLQVLEHKTVGTHALIPPWLLALGGAGIVLGLATWGWRVIETIGDKITELTPTRGFCAEFGAAATILFASKLGLPISTTHALVGAVFGVGMARGLQALNLKTLKEIVTSWIVTIPLCALFSILAYLLFLFLFS